MNTLTTLLHAAESWWNGESMAGNRQAVTRYGRAERTFHLSALLGLSGVRDLDVGRKTIQTDAPTIFYAAGGIGDYWRRWAPFGCAWGISPTHGRAALNKSGNLAPEKAYDAATLLHGLADDDAARAAAPIIRQTLLSGSKGLRDDAWILTTSMSNLAADTDWPKSRTDRRRQMRLAFRTLVIDHGPAGVKVGAVMASAEEEQATKRANAQKTRRKAEQEKAIRSGADPVGQAMAVLAKWVGDGMADAHLPTPLPKIGKGKTAKTATRRNAYEYLAKMAPRAIQTLDDAAEGKITKAS